MLYRSGAHIQGFSPGGGGSARYAEGVGGKTGQVWGVSRGSGVSCWRWKGLR